MIEDDVTERRADEITAYEYAIAGQWYRSYVHRALPGICQSSGLRRRLNQLMKNNQSHKPTTIQIQTGEGILG